MRRLVLRFIDRVWLGLVLALCVALMLGFFPADSLLATVRLPVAALIVVCTMGKALYDTLFYDHYWP
ncbi:MAG: hypothetical protein Q7O66_01660 [Dehalococcoidia bacterium]|nr:hypothetical protein [Dehalococcoidia bacterium]